MIRRLRLAGISPAFACVLTIASVGIAQDRSDPVRPPKKILVELFTSQGCNSCPSANQFMGEFTKLGLDPDRVIPVAFHVDYFNTPWADPFSKPEYSRREMAYNAVLKRNDLYFTPMMMVDGRTPMLGSNRPEALKAIKLALADRPVVKIKLTADDAGSNLDRPVKLEVTPLGPEVSGRSLMIGLALTEGPITTKVPSGENAGVALVEPAIVRRFSFQQSKLEDSGPKAFRFTLQPPPDARLARCRLVGFVQDWDNGKVYQAESTPWLASTAPARR